MKLHIDVSEWHLLMEALELLQEKFPNRLDEVKKTKLYLLDQRNQLLSDFEYQSNFAVAYGAAPTSNESDYYTYSLILTSIPESAKIGTIKVLREIAKLNMQEAFIKIKELPLLVKGGLNRSDAENKAYEFTRLGCVVSIEKDDGG